MKLGAVVAAAGLSRRMGREKILLRFGEASVLERVLATLAAAGVADRVVVLRPGLPEAYEQARRAGASVVINPSPEEEMLLSIRMGIGELALDLQAFYVWPADHPAVLPETLVTLAMEAGSDRIVLPTHRGRRGHPALVGDGLIQAIAQIPAGEGLRHLWHADPQLVREVPVEDSGVLLDLDTPEDYDAALRAASRTGGKGDGGTG
jgi:CTP:molybdopterin cytidylyltransferase MocA